MIFDLVALALIGAAVGGMALSHWLLDNDDAWQSRPDNWRDERQNVTPLPPVYDWERER